MAKVIVRLVLVTIGTVVACVAALCLFASYRLTHLERRAR